MKGPSFRANSVPLAFHTLRLTHPTSATDAPMNPKKLRPLLAALALGCALSTSAFAAEDPAATPGHPKHEEFCKNNPTTCETLKERRDNRKDWCEKNPEKCQNLKDERKARHEKAKAACDANPKECDEKKTQMREHMKERRELRKQHREEHQEQAAPAK